MFSAAGLVFLALLFVGSIVNLLDSGNSWDIRLFRLVVLALFIYFFRRRLKANKDNPFLALQIDDIDNMCWLSA